MSRSPRLLLEDILEAAQLLADYTAGLDFTEFSRNQEKQDAVARRLEIIGEAVKRIPDSLREAHSDVPWREIAGARDVVVHEYFRLDLELVWEMVRSDVPQLARRVREILSDLT